MQAPEEDIKQALQTYYTTLIKESLFEDFCFEQKYQMDLLEFYELINETTDVQKKQDFEAWQPAIKKKIHIGI